MMARLLTGFCRAAPGAGRIPAWLPDLARRDHWRGRSVLPALFYTLAGGGRFPFGAIPGGRGGPQSVAPVLPVDLRAVPGRTARLFGGGIA